jgi:hypothetical protein
MRIGILADVHENLSHLRWAIDVLSEQRSDRLVFLGDLFELGHQLKETVDLLAKAGAIGVWGTTTLASAATTREWRTGSGMASLFWHSWVSYVPD